MFVKIFYKNKFLIRISFKRVKFNLYGVKFNFISRA